MKIGELAKRSGFSAHTIRYYERIGLLPYADRDQSKQRDYDASILIWIEFLGRLKTTGMPIRDMLRYAKLRDRGVSTEVERRKLLEVGRSPVPDCQLWVAQRCWNVFLSRTSKVSTLPI
ncbi:MAG: MerR family transcriptional regulator [Hyphomicrobiaceae bacterium]